MFERLPPISADAMTAEQREAVADFKASRGSELFGPFVPLIRSPELLLRVSALGEYLRYRSSLSHRLREFAILITAREWTQHYEWELHSRIAAKVGVSADTIQAVAEGRRPAGMPDDEETLYRFCTELHSLPRVSDETYGRAVEAFGEQGVIDMIGICGYYSLLAMVLNTAAAPVPDTAGPALKPLPR